MLNFGQILLAILLSLSVFQAVKNLILKQEDIKFFTQINLTIANFILVVFSFCWLEYKYIISDFSIFNVFQNSNTLKPLIYKITGVWGNHEGSMLLFALLISAYSFLFCLSSKTSLKDEILKYQSIIFSFILGYIYFFSNPFEFSPKMPNGEFPSQGIGLNPLLQDIGLAIHPPILYIGYAGFSLVFSYAIALCRSENFDVKIWAEQVKIWALISWSFLTIGVMLGSWWAYRELGWGGFWFWDPVENISLMPWLIGCALIHSLLYTKKFGGLTRSSVFLAILSFLLALIGFFLVRSGILSSVHSFANSPERGVAMLVIVFLISIYSSYQISKNFARLKPKIFEDYSALSRQALVVANVVLFFSIAVTLLLGIIYPIILDILNLSQISVGEPYFNKTIIPITLSVLLIMVFTPFIKWQNEKLISIAKKSYKSFFISIIFTALICFFYPSKFNFISIIALFAGFWVFTSLLEILSIRFVKREKISRGFFAMSISHIGFAGLCIIIAMLTSLEEKHSFNLTKDKNIKINNYKISYVDSEILRGENFLAQKLTLQVKDGKNDLVFYPENRVYMPSFTKTNEADVKSFIDKDLYFVMGETEEVSNTSDKKRAGERVYNFPITFYVKPLISFLWIFAIVIAIGGFLAATAKKKN
ncbi:MAG: heme lyase CcmF/NrfE family subunit [Rickettsiales bacterium]|nr:heme lyase CcmF/NrfE family subunit [Rickettsiales bacterium]